MPKAFMPHFKKVELYFFLADLHADAKKRQSRQIAGTGEETRDKVAAFTGMGARSLDKADAIVSAAEADPDKFGKLLRGA